MSDTKKHVRDSVRAKYNFKISVEVDSQMMPNELTQCALSVSVIDSAHLLSLSVVYVVLQQKFIVIGFVWCFIGGSFVRFHTCSTRKIYVVLDSN